jgi:hypothetical protein
VKIGMIKKNGVATGKNHNDSETDEEKNIDEIKI